MIHASNKKRDRHLFLFLLCGNTAASNGNAKSGAATDSCRGGNPFFPYMHLRQQNR